MIEIEKGPQISIKQVQNFWYQIAIFDVQLLAQISALKQKITQPHIQLLNQFQNHGKLRSVSYSYTSKNGKQQFITKIQKQKLKNSCLIQFSMNLHHRWIEMVRQFKELIQAIEIQRKDQQKRIKIYSIGATSIQFSLTFPEYYNKQFLFSYSQLEYHSNMPLLSNVDINTESHLRFSFESKNFFNIPQPSFFSKISIGKSQSKMLKNLKKYFLIGLTLQALHFYTDYGFSKEKEILSSLKEQKALLEKEDKDNKYSSRYEQINNYLDFINSSFIDSFRIVKLEFFRKVAHNTLLLTGVDMNGLRIYLEYEDRTILNKSTSQDGLSILISNNAQNIIKIRIDIIKTKEEYPKRLNFSDNNQNFHCLNYFNRYKNHIRGLNYHQDQNTITFEYKYRIYFEYFIISLELYCLYLLNIEWQDPFKQIIVKKLNKQAKQIEINYKKELVIVLQPLERKQFLLHFRCVSLSYQKSTRDEKCEQIFENYLNYCLRIWNLRDFIREFCQMYLIRLNYPFKIQQDKILIKILDEDQYTSHKKICRIKLQKSSNFIIIFLRIYQNFSPVYHRMSIRYNLDFTKQIIYTERTKDSIISTKQRSYNQFLNSYSIQQFL